MHSDQQIGVSFVVAIPKNNPRISMFIEVSSALVCDVIQCCFVRFTCVVFSGHFCFEKEVLEFFGGMFDKLYLPVKAIRYF